MMNDHQTQKKRSRDYREKPPSGHPKRWLQKPPVSALKTMNIGTGGNVGLGILVIGLAIATVLVCLIMVFQ